jgi:hypothetical protein
MALKDAASTQLRTAAHATAYSAWSPSRCPTLIQQAVSNSHHTADGPCRFHLLIGNTSATVALDFNLGDSGADGFRASTQAWPAGAGTRCCPPAGRRVFVGRRGLNPCGVSLVFQRRIQSASGCPSTAAGLLAAKFTVAQKVSDGVRLGESCSNGRGRLFLKPTIPAGGSIGECWQGILRLTDGTRRTIAMKLV